MLNEAELNLLKAAIRMNMIVMAVAFGLLAGGILWLSTVILLLRGGYDVGLHLSLLSVFLPGYSVTWGGAWIGLAWGFFVGGLSGAILYWSYARTLRERLGQPLARGARCHERAHAADLPDVGQCARHRAGVVDGTATVSHHELVGRARHRGVQPERRASRAVSARLLRFVLQEASSARWKCSRSGSSSPTCLP